MATPTEKKAPLKRDDNTFILRDAFYPTVEKALANKSSVDAFVRYVSEYRNRNIDLLSRVYPAKTLFFERNGEDTNIVFRTCNVNKSAIMPVIKQARKAVLLDQIKSDENVEFFTILIMMMKYFYKNPKVLHACYMYYAYGLWHLVYKKFYNKFSPPEEVVEYTINELNNKYLAKRLGSLDLALESIMQNTVVWAEDRLERLSDKDIIDIIQGIRTRINNFNKTMGNRIHANAKAGNRVLNSSDTNEETGELLTDRENNLGSCSVLASEYTTKFFTNGPQMKEAELAAKFCSGVSIKEVYTAIQLIHSEGNTREVKLFYECLFYAFFQYNPKATPADVKSMLFPAAANAIYKKGNSIDKNVLQLKELSHKWLQKGSKTYRVSNSAATKNSFRKAIFMYFAFVCATNG